MQRYIYHVGPKQRALLRAILSGDRLYQEGGRWYLYNTNRARYRQFQSKERCIALYTHGYIMSVETHEGSQYVGGYRVRYDITQKGKQA